MDFRAVIFKFCFIFALSTSISAKVPAPEDLQFIKATVDVITVSFTGIEKVEKYEVSIQALYDKTDTNGWIMSLDGSTTSTITLDQLDGLKSNILYKVKVAGILDEEVGNFSEVIGRTAASGLDLSPTQVLPSLAIIYVTETPGATLCQVAYNKVGQSTSSEQFVESEADCRVNIIRNLDANTPYYVRGRVLKAGGHDYPENEYGQAIGFTTAKLSLYARVDQNVAYETDLGDSSTVTYRNRADSAASALLSLHQENGADASEINVLQFEPKNIGILTVIHYEISLETSTLPSSLVNYNFVDDSGEFELMGVDSKVKPDTYSLIRTDDNYRLRYNDNTNGTGSAGCPTFDSRQLVISNSVDRGSRAVSLQGFSPLGTTDFTILGTALSMSSGANLYFFDNNSANAISQKYLLKTCPDGQSDLLFSRYFGAKDSSTTPGLEDVFVHSTDLFSFPGIRSVGIMQGNGSLLTFKRVPNAVEYIVSGGSRNATLDITKIDSSVEFEIEISPIDAGVAIDATLEITTKPYDEPKEKSNPISLNTLPSLPTGVTWPYRDENNLTLAWDKDDGAVGYFINVQWDRQGALQFEQEFETLDPEAKMNNLKPGRNYFVKVIAYNHAGNASDNAGYQLYTNQDHPLLMRDAVNVTHVNITVEWSGGKDPNSVEIRVTSVNNSTNFSSSYDVTTPPPFTITGLEPETEYNVTVVVTYDTGDTESPYRVYETDPEPTTPSYETTTEIATTDSLNETTEFDMTTQTIYASTNDTATEETTGWTTDGATTDDTNTQETTDQTSFTETTAVTNTEVTTTSALESTAVSTESENTASQDTTVSPINTTNIISITTETSKLNTTVSMIATINTSITTGTSKLNNTDSDSTNTNEANTDSTKTSTDADNPPEQEGLNLEWWVWVLIAVGVILLMAIIAIVTNIAMAAASGQASNSTGLMKAIFGRKGMYAVNKPGGPTPVLTNESFLN